MVMPCLGPVDCHRPGRCRTCPRQRERELPRSFSGPVDKELRCCFPVSRDPITTRLFRSGNQSRERGSVKADAGNAAQAAQTAQAPAQTKQGQRLMPWVLVPLALPVVYTAYAIVRMVWSEKRPHRRNHFARAAKSVCH